MIEPLERLLQNNVPRETIEKLEAFAGFLREENTRQNLIAASTLELLWERHILDSAQLVRFEPRPGVRWADVGSGAGLPGVVVACLVSGPVTLIEPRQLRADFLHRVSESLGLNTRVFAKKVEHVHGFHDVITARAVAPLSRLLKISHHLSTKNTIWVLPKGRNAAAELAEARQSWQGVFHVEQSVTDGDSKIVVATGVRTKP